MTSEEEEPKRGFKVQDRRRFSASGETLESPAEEASPAPPPPAEEVPRPPDSERASAAPGAEMAINFSTFVLSLSTQALAHLGEIPDPIDNATRVDLPAARQLIDILAMLQEKTAGNLDPSEAEFLQHALYDLRMRFVDQTQKR